MLATAVRTSERSNAVLVIVELLLEKVEFDYAGKLLRNRCRG
jgi:hypothetical protein